MNRIDLKLSEASPMLPTRAQSRMSYSHTAFTDTESSCSKLPGMRRAHSVPVFSQSDRSFRALSPIFFDRYLVTEGGGLVSSAFNLASATCGAGVIALPYAMQHCGLLTGSIILMLVCVLTIYSVYLLAKVSSLTKLMTYEELACDLVGPMAEKMTAIIVVVFCWGVAVMYVVVIADLVGPLLEATGLFRSVDRRTVTVLFWVFIMFPLSLVRKIRTLSYASIVGTVSTLLLAGALIERFAERSGHDSYDGSQSAPTPTTSHSPLVRWDFGGISALSTMVFSYCCQPVAPRIYEELKDRSVKRMSLCAICSMTTVTLVYTITGVFGAMCFGDAVEPNVLVNFTHLDSHSAQLGYLGMVIAVTMAFPITIFPTRDSLVMAMGYRDEENPVPEWLSRTIAGLLALLALLIGITVPNIRILFDILGGVCGGSLSFFFPALFALCSGYWTTAEVGRQHVLFTWMTLVFGVVVSGLGTYSSLKTNFF